MPAEGLSNGGQFEVKELEVTENGTYEEKGEMYNKVTVNVEGGGGSSDFSTATLTVNGNLSPTGLNLLPTLLVDPEYGLAGAYGSTNGLSSPFTVILYKGKAYADLPQGKTSGGIVYDEDIEMYVITGDGTLTIMS